MFDRNNSEDQKEQNNTLKKIVSENNSKQN